jgi:hypothetical protein
METGEGQLKTSGVSLIEIIAVVALVLIVSASIQVVSNGRIKTKSRHSTSPGTNELRRDFHAPVDVIHTYAPRH